MAGKGQTSALTILILGDAKGASKAMKQTSGDVEALGGKTRKLAGDIGQLFIAYQGARFLGDAISGGASLIEAQNTVKIVFEESSATVEKFAKDAVNTYALSEKAALQAANGYGLLLTNMGIGEKQAADWSVTLTSLASDLSAFSDLPLEQALEAIQSGIAGQSRPLMAFGIRLTEFKVRQAALDAGLKVGKGTLDDYSRAVGTYNIIMAESSKAQGQFARESDGLKQRQQQLNAEWTNAKDTLGTGLIPVMQTGVTVAGAMLHVWGALPGVAQKSVLGLGALVIMVPRLYRGFKSAGDAAVFFRMGLQGMTRSGDGAAAATGSLVNKLGGVKAIAGIAAGGLTVLVAAYVVWQTKQEEAKQKAAEFTAEIKAMRDQAVETGDSLVEVFTKATLKEWATDNRDQLESWGISAADLQKVLTGSEEDFNSWLDTVAEAQGAFKAGGGWQFTDSGDNKFFRQFDEMRTKYRALGEATDDYAATKKDLGLADDDAAEAADGLASSLDGVSTAADEQKSALDRATEAVENYYEKAKKRRDLEQGVADAHRGRLEAQQELVDLQATAAGKGEDYARATEAIADAVEGAADAEKDLAKSRTGAVEAQNAVRDAQVDLNEARKEAAERLRDMALAARESATAEAGARIELQRARKEQERINSSGADALKRAEAAQAVREAEDNLVSATKDRGDKQSENARAQAAGVEGDQGVIDAKKGIVDAQAKVVDANDQVKESEKRVRDAQDQVTSSQAAQRAVVTDAKAKIEEATRDVEDAIADEAQAWGDLATEQSGATEGIRLHREMLLALTADLDPDSPLRQRLRGFAEDLAASLTPFHSTGEASMGSSAPPGMLNAERQGRASIQVNQYLSGTSTQQARATGAAASQALLDVLSGAG